MDDENGANLDEYRTAPLTFQERSLRQYFRALSVEQHGNTELRTPASAAQVAILTMCVQALLGSATSSEGDKASELINYAAKYWYEHFNELDVLTATEAEIARVLKCLYPILTNENNVAKAFDRQTVPSQLYPESKKEDAKPWYDRLQPWLAKAGSLPDTALDRGIKQWALMLTENPKATLLPLARGHLNNWFADWNFSVIMDSYDNAEATLRIVGCFLHLSGSSLLTVVLVW